MFTPEGIEAFSDTARAQIAAAASARAEAPPRLELYPVGLDLERALRITQAIGYLGGTGSGHAFPRWRDLAVSSCTT